MLFYIVLYWTVLRHQAVYAYICIKNVYVYIHIITKLEICKILRDFMDMVVRDPGDCINMMMSFHQYRNSSYKRKTISWLFYLDNGHPYTWKHGLNIEMVSRAPRVEDVQVHWTDIIIYYLQSGIDIWRHTPEGMSGKLNWYENVIFSTKYFCHWLHWKFKKWSHFDDNFRCSQWLFFSPNHDISILVYMISIIMKRWSEQNIVRINIQDPNKVHIYTSLARWSKVYDMKKIWSESAQ